MNKSICYIVGAGEQFHPLPRPAQGDLVIAADGGYAFLAAAGIAADIFVGDFDSLAPESKASGASEADGAQKPSFPASCRVVTLPVIKDCTDTAAAIELGLEAGYRRFYIYGGTGGRPDHTLANIQCLAAIARRGGQASLIDRDNIITCICNGSLSFPPQDSGFISVFSLSDFSQGVSESGLKYTITDAKLTNTVPLGVSNEFTGAASEISVQKGTLIIVYPYQLLNRAVYKSYI